MKKIFQLILILFGISLFVACNNEQIADLIAEENYSLADAENDHGTEDAEQSIEENESAHSIVKFGYDYDRTSILNRNSTMTDLELFIMSLGSTDSLEGKEDFLIFARTFLENHSGNLIWEEALHPMHMSEESGFDYSRAIDYESLRTWMEGFCLGIVLRSFR